MSTKNFDKSAKKTTIIICILFSVLVYTFVLIQSPLPDRSELVSASGSVINYRATGKREDALRFKIRGHDAWLVVNANLSAQGTKARMEKYRNSITVLYDPYKSHSPPFDSRSYHTVYEISQGDNVVSSYTQALEEREKNKAVGRYVALLFLVAGILFIFVPAASSKVKDNSG